MLAKPHCQQWIQHTPQLSATHIIYGDRPNWLWLKDPNYNKMSFSVIAFQVNLSSPLFLQGERCATLGCWQQLFSSTLQNALMPFCIFSHVKIHQIKHQAPVFAAFLCFVIPLFPLPVLQHALLTLLKRTLHCAPSVFVIAHSCVCDRALHCTSVLCLRSR